MPKRTRTTYTKTCPFCAVGFSTRDQRQKHCGIKCSRAATTGRTMLSKTCPKCNQDFETRYRWQICCSRGCLSKYPQELRETRQALLCLWHNMHIRCEDKTNKAYYRYGGRGIYVCEEWITFEPFYRWALSSGYQRRLSLDRFPNNDGPYSPENCRWANARQQQQNMRSNRNITAWGETKCLSEWVRDDRAKYRHSSIARRIESGMTCELAIGGMLSADSLNPVP